MIKSKNKLDDISDHNRLKSFLREYKYPDFDEINSRYRQKTD